MSVLTKTTHRRKHAMEELHLLSLRFRCFMSPHVDVSQDPKVKATLQRLLNQIKKALPSPEFQANYMHHMGTIGSDGRFALHINDDMTQCTVLRTSTLANVHQFLRGGA